MSDPAWIAVGPVDFALDVSRNPNMQKGKVMDRKCGRKVLRKCVRINMGAG